MAGRNESFFHGTASHISDAVRPGAELGKSQWEEHGAEFDQPSNQHAFATTHEDEAWRFAKTAHAIQHSNFAGQGSPPGRARVYTVAPHPDMRPGVYNPTHPKHDQSMGPLHEYIAPSFKVTGRLDVQPGHQGTFPTINWRQFSHPDISGDPSHPTPNEVTEGMRFIYGSERGKGNQAKARRSAQSIPRTEVTGQLPLFPHPDERR